MTFRLLFSVCFLSACKPTCEAVEAAANQAVQDVLQQPQLCDVNEDCEVVAVNGSCFDSCSAVIATANRAAFDAAIATAEAEHCVDFDGCTLIVPPCAPPDPATCSDQGFCEGG